MRAALLQSREGDAHERDRSAQRRRDVETYARTGSSECGEGQQLVCESDVEISARSGKRTSSRPRVPPKNGLSSAEGHLQVHRSRGEVGSTLNQATFTMAGEEGAREQRSSSCQTRDVTPPPSIPCRSDSLCTQAPLDSSLAATDSIDRRLGRTYAQSTAHAAAHSCGRVRSTVGGLRRGTA